jgi:hypothetical protein
MDTNDDDERDAMRWSSHRSQLADAERLQSSLDSSFGPADVLCGRGKISFNHVGNKRFRELISRSMERYMGAETRFEKSLVVQSVIEEIQQSGGRFLKKDISAGKWVEVSAHHTNEKVGHALRDAANSYELKKKRDVESAAASTQIPRDALSSVTGIVSHTMPLHRTSQERKSLENVAVGQRNLSGSEQAGQNETFPTESKAESARLVGIHHVRTPVIPPASTQFTPQFSSNTIMDMSSALSQNFEQQEFLRSRERDLISLSQQQMQESIQHQMQQREIISRRSGFPVLPNDEHNLAPYLYNREEAYPSAFIHGNTGVPPSLPQPPYQQYAPQYQNIAAGTGFSFPFQPIGGSEAHFQTQETIALHDLNRQGMNYQQRLIGDAVQHEASLRRYSSDVAVTQSSLMDQQVQQRQSQPSQSFQLPSNRLEDSNDHFLSAINEVLGPQGNDNDDTQTTHGELDDPV